MKKIYISLLTILGFSAISIAQPTLTSSNFSLNIGESQLFYVADTNTVINTLTGANVTFDYSALQGYGVTQTQYTLDPATTNFTTVFPSATLADSTEGYPINKNYMQLHSTDSLTKTGIVANIPTYGTVIGKYDANPETTMKFPFNYLDIYFDNYAGEFTVNAAVPVNTPGNGNVTVSADAWGTLLLPNGVSISDVIRIKTTEYLITDAIILPFPFNTTINPITISGVNINYYKPSISKYPLLSIVNGSYTQDNAIIDSSSAIISQYPLTLITGIDEVNSISTISLFPNPSKNGTSNLTVSLKESNKVSIELFNSVGQNIATILNKTLPQGVNNIKLNTSKLSAGIYFVNISVNNTLTTKKLIIE